MQAEASAFGARLRELRERAGLSQRRLARLVHVDHSVISRVEGGLRRPDALVARALDQVLSSAFLSGTALSSAETGGGAVGGDAAGGGELERLARAIPRTVPPTRAARGGGLVSESAYWGGGDEGRANNRPTGKVQGEKTTAGEAADETAGDIAAGDIAAGATDEAGAEAVAPKADALGVGASPVVPSAGVVPAPASGRSTSTSSGSAGSVLVPPPDTVHFIGRGAELDSLGGFFRSGSRAGPAPVCVVSGMPGLGKTALAIHAAYLLAARFPDGCLFLDLQGFAPGREPLSAYDALGLVLGDLGLPQESVSSSEHGRAVRYRGATRDRRLLIVLDNAVTGAQVRPLLPSGGGCGVLVTSRNSLAALDDALHIALPVLDRSDAAALFRSVAAAPRASAAAVRRIVALCGGVPLAIRIIAARCRLDSALTPEGLADELAAQLSRDPVPGRAPDRGRPARLDLGGGERSLGEAFDVSFGSLPAEQRSAFAHLGLFAPAAADARAVAALVDASAASIGRVLEQLAAAGLLEPQGPDCYRLHDLVAAYARTAAERTLSPDAMRAAVGRMLDEYLLRCHAADLVVTPHRYRFPLAATARARAPAAFAGYDAALGWLAGRIDTLSSLCDLAYRHGFDEHCWQLAYTLRGVFFIGKYWTQWEATHRVAVAAARRAGDVAAQARTLNNLGLVLGERGRGEEARACFAEAIELCRAVGDAHGEYTARSHRAWLLHRAGRFDEALAEQRAALDFQRRAGLPRNVAIILRDMAATEAELGRTGEAREHLRTALDAFRVLGLALDAVMALNGLAELHSRVGDLGAAEDFHQAALDAGRAVGSVYEQARAHAGLGRNAARRGLPARARHQLTRAARLFDSLGAQTEAARVRAELRAAEADGVPAGRSARV